MVVGDVEATYSFGAERQGTISIQGPGKVSDAAMQLKAQLMAAIKELAEQSNVSLPEVDLMEEDPSVEAQESKGSKKGQKRRK